MGCNFIPDKILKKLGDKASVKISKQLRSDRSKIKRIYKKILVEQEAEGRLR